MKTNSGTQRKAEEQDESEASVINTPSPDESTQGTIKEKDKEKAPAQKSSKLPQKCPLTKCLLCTREQPYCLARGPTWPAIMRVVFYVLQSDKPAKDFFNLKEDVYNVMLWHWDKLSIQKKSSLNWKKHIQDMLSHSKDLFESGLEIYGQNGYWRLKVNTDPWTLSGKTRRTPKKEMMAKRAREAEPAPTGILAVAEPPPKRPFVPFIVRSGVVNSASPNLSYVFVNERTSPPQSSDINYSKSKLAFPMNGGNLFGMSLPFPSTSTSPQHMAVQTNYIAHPPLQNEPYPSNPQTSSTNEEQKMTTKEEDGIVPQLCSKFAQFDKEIRMKLSPTPVPSPDSVESTFKMFANAKPCNPCPVSFLLNES